MDNRLDFFNTINNYSETLTEDDAFLFISHNKKQGDAFFGLSGDWELISILFSVNGYTNVTDAQRENFENVKKTILNTALNICSTDLATKQLFINALKSL
jgi:hypothetical protein